MENNSTAQKPEFWKCLVAYTAPIWAYFLLAALCGLTESVFTFDRYSLIGLVLGFVLPLVLLCNLMFNKWAIKRNASLLATPSVQDLELKHR